MTQLNTGAYALLEAPWIYETIQSLMGADRMRRRFVDFHVRPNRRDRILDIGCGPAELLHYLGDVVYVGFEPSAAYVQRARKTFGNRGTFFAKPFEEADAVRFEPFDIAVMTGLLHHLDDAEARDLFRLLRRSLKSGGRAISIDPVFVPVQNPVARFIISKDRGRNVRSPDGYRALVAGIFDNVRSSVEAQRFPPYTRIIMELS
jgi:SAM-dependent methyltransferase